MLVDKSGRVWAMRHDPSAIMEAAQFRDGIAENGEVKALGGDPLDGSDFARVIDGVAVVPVRGALMRKFSFWAWSYEEIARDIALAEANPNVHATVLDIDSPGGLVAGVDDLAAFIRNETAKPTQAFVGGMAASAAYYIASATDKITLGSGATVGSIGAVVEYVDMEPVFEAMGAKIVRAVSAVSPNKRLDPDSDEGRAELQALVDASGEEFVAAVAVGRRVTEDRVLARFGQGLMFDGAKAIDLGMADQRGTLQSLIAELAGRDAIQSAVPAAAAEGGISMNWDDLTLAALREHRADIADEIAAEARDGVDTTAAATAATETERARITGILEIAKDGHDDLVSAAIADGTSPEALAMKMLKAEKAAGSAHIAAMKKADESAQVPATPAADDDITAGGTPEEQAEAKWDADAKLRAEFNGKKSAYMAFAKAEAKGHTRVLSRAN